MKAGDVIYEKDVFPLRPLKKGCVYPYEIESVIGKKLDRDVEADECLKWEMIENG